MKNSPRSLFKLGNSAVPVRKPISRRLMLRGATAAVGLPLLECMMGSSIRSTQAVQTAAKPPVRLCYLYFPNGVAPGSWDPVQTSDQSELKALNLWMAPLEKHKDNLLLLRNVWTPRGNGHGAGTATWLTAGGYDPRKIDAGGLSADQLAAKTLGTQTMLPSLELSLEGEGFFSNSLPRNTISWSENNTPVTRETEPRAVFDRMFGSTGQNRAVQKSTLDLVLEEANQLKRKIGRNDNRKIDEYLESIRAVERRMDFSQKKSELAEQNPELKKFMKRPEAGIPDDHGEYMRLMYDMLVLAFWSDATRVSTYMLDHGQSNRYFNFIDGVMGTWHAISHWRDTSGKTEDDDGKHSWISRDQKQQMYNRIVMWHHRQFGYFLDRLTSIEEAGRPLLDQCSILYGSSLADGHSHQARNLPLLVAGKAGGHCLTGKVSNFKRSTSMSRLHLSMLQSAGVPVKEFGGSNSPLQFG